MKIDVLYTDRLWNYCRLVDEQSIEFCVYDHFQIRKVCTLWVFHALTENQKLQKVKWCQKMLKRFEAGSFWDLNSIITDDETCLY